MTLERRDDGFILKGAVTFDTVQKVLDSSERAFAEEKKIVIDLAAVTEVDSSALSLMLEWLRRSRARGAEVEFTNPGSAISSLTDLYGLQDLLPVRK